MFSIFKYIKSLSINFFKKNIRLIPVFLQKQKKFFISMIGSYFCLFVVNVLAIDPSQDMLTPVKADVQANFGASSTFMWIVYACEIVCAAIAFNKVKNPLVLTSIVILVIFVNFAFVLI